MNTFDPIAVRKAVTEYSPQRLQRFHDLSTVKDFIAELRQKHASYRAIAELLTQHCLHTSKSAVAAFCHVVLGERVRPKRRPKRLPSPAQPAAVPTAAPGVPAPISADADSPPETPARKPAEPRPRGPRIAQVRLIPQSHS